MAATTTAVNACDCEIWLDDAGGVARDISGSMSKFSFGFSQKLGEYEVFTDGWMYRLCCGRDVTFTLNIVYTMAANEGMDIIRNWCLSATGATSCAPRTLTLYIPDKNVGSDRIQAEVKWESMDADVDRGVPGPIPVTLVVKSTGAVTHSTAAT